MKKLFLIIGLFLSVSLVTADEKPKIYSEAMSGAIVELFGGEIVNELSLETDGYPTYAHFISIKDYYNFFIVKKSINFILNHRFSDEFKTIEDWYMDEDADYVYEVGFYNTNDEYYIITFIYLPNSDKIIVSVY